jgi:hypothetical protein
MEPQPKPPTADIGEQSNSIETAFTILATEEQATRLASLQDFIAESKVSYLGNETTSVAKHMRRWKDMDATYEAESVPKNNTWAVTKTYNDGSAERIAFQQDEELGITRVNWSGNSSMLKRVGFWNPSNSEHKAEEVDLSFDAKLPIPDLLTDTLNDPNAPVEDKLHVQDIAERHTKSRLDQMIEDVEASRTRASRIKNFLGRTAQRASFH